MKKVLISEEANKEITTLLECIIFSNGTNPDVDGMYMKEYDFENRDFPTIELVMLVNSPDFPIESIRKFYALNIEGILKKYGVNIRVSAISSNLISYFPDLDFGSMENFEIIVRYDKCRDLMNSRVVYDPDGKYEDLRERMLAVHNKDTLKYNNLIEFVPPIKLERKK